MSKPPPNTGNNGVWQGDSWKKADDGPPEPPPALTRPQAQHQAGLEFTDGKLTREQYRITSDYLSTVDFDCVPILPPTKKES